MRLPQKSAHPRPPVALNYEQVFNYKAVRCQFINDLHMRQPLAIGAYLILALDDVHAARTQYP